jgi:hypothetical protein
MEKLEVMFGFYGPMLYREGKISWHFVHSLLFLNLHYFYTRARSAGLRPAD